MIAPRVDRAPTDREPPPEARLMDLLAGRFVSQAVACAAELRIADHLEAGPRASDAIAEAIGAHPPSLYRLLRMLAMFGVLTERDDRIFSLTPVGACLRTGAPGSLAAMARFIGDAPHSAACVALAHAVRTGESGFRCAHGEETFTWLATHPDAAKVFHDAMTSISSSASDAIVAAYDFTELTRIADVGGGHGHLLLRILEASPNARGVLFDRREVVEAAGRRVAESPYARRCAVVAGDFFAQVPAGCDAYVLKNVLHDWDDDACVAILKRCAARLDDRGRVIVIEQLLTPPGVPSFAKVLDVEMLIMTDGGRERTIPEFAALFAAAGLRLARVVATESPMHVMDARAV